MALAHCRACGHRVSTTAPKCPGCGTPPTQPSRNDDGSIRFCTRCGARVTVHDAFCYSCGAQRNQLEANAPPTIGRTAAASPPIVEQPVNSNPPKPNLPQSTAGGDPAPTVASPDATANAIGVPVSKGEARNRLPGFRTSRPWKIFLALIGYASVAILLLIGVSFGDLLTFTFGIELLAGILLVGNAWNLRSEFPC